MDQVHRITTIIEKTLEEKKVCCTVFLDVAQAFDKVWHEGLFHKTEQHLPAEYNKMLESYLSDRYFRVKQEHEYSELKQIKAGMPQRSVLGLVLYLLYTIDLHQLGEATEKLQRAVDKVNKWTRKWLIKLNKAKSVHVDFTNKRCHHIPITVGYYFAIYMAK